MVQLEIAVHTIESALAAQAGGADRLELFTNPFEGGVTPGQGLIAVVRSKVALKLHVMVRPRGGDFCYSDAEFDAMLQDVAAARTLGADGVVFGLLNVDGTIDKLRTHKLVSASKPLSSTFHRAFDMCADLPAALEDLNECGVHRVLTSGGEATAIQGREMLAKLVSLAQSRITIVAGGGINAGNARQLVRGTAVREIHAGLRTSFPSPVQFRNPRISFGPGGEEYERVIVREEDVRQLKEEIAGL